MRHAMPYAEQEHCKSGNTPTRHAIAGAGAGGTAGFGARRALSRRLDTEDLYDHIVTSNDEAGDPDALRRAGSPAPGEVPAAGILLDPVRSAFGLDAYAETTGTFL